MRLYTRRTRVSAAVRYSLLLYPYDSEGAKEKGGSCVLDSDDDEGGGE